MGFNENIMKYDMIILNVEIKMTFSETVELNMFFSLEFSLCFSVLSTHVQSVMLSLIHFN